MLKKKWVVLISIFLLGIAANAMACTMGLTWQPPTAREDGAPLLRSDIAKIELRCVGVDVAGSVVKYAKPGARGYRITSSRLPAGVYSCVAITHDTAGQVSRPSAPAVGRCL